MRLTSPRSLRVLVRLLLAALLPALLLTAVQALWQSDALFPQLLMRWAFTLAILLFSLWTPPHRAAPNVYTWPGLPVIAGCLAAGGLAYLLAPDVTLAAWLMLVGAYTFLIGLDRIVASQQGWWRRVLLRLLVAALAGGFALFVYQSETHFAEEEFFGAVLMVILTLYWLLVRLLVGNGWAALKRPQLPSLRVNRLVISVIVGLLAWSGVVILVHRYQSSFYTTSVPVFPGISEASPFICGEAQTTSSDQVGGAEVFSKLLSSIESSPNKRAAELGMLTLGTAQTMWAEQFREALLAEARQGKFAGPAHSVKYQQYLAAQSLYYYLAVGEAFPELFSLDDRAVLDDWFLEINRRAQTVEWVDWMYGLAFTKWPEGPYENQEVGAALLTLMERGSLSTPDLSRQNRAYLARSQKGWGTRFANTDDAFVYQPEWITNAYLQSLYWGAPPEANLRHSFEWLALQMLPDGSAPDYNHPSVTRTAGALYLGAVMTGDPEYVWLADRSLDAMVRSSAFPIEQPGVDRAVDLVGAAPDYGSCLIYGDSGLPNQQGPLAPDKIVLRSGWSDDAPYLLQNLRFTGWHRYKATQAISLIHWGRTVSKGQLSGASFGWLPKGRSLFRDKRIPRENLNALSVERTGMSALVQTLTGWGSRWAQDPPLHAEVIAFVTGATYDYTHTRLSDWRGWTHDRQITLYHPQGPIVVVDDVQGPPNREAVLSWHFSADSRLISDGIVFPDDDHPTSVRFVCLPSDGECPVGKHYSDELGGVSIVSTSEFRVASIFLFKDWMASTLTIDELRQLLTVSSCAGTVSIQLP